MNTTIEVITAFGLGWKVDDKNYTKYRDKYGIDTEEWSGEEIIDGKRRKASGPQAA